MSLHDCVINWDAPACLKDVNLPTTQGATWVGDPIYDGTVAGAIRKFRELPAELQTRTEMMIDPGVIAGSLAATIVSYDALCEIADRDDVPKD